MLELIKKQAATATVIVPLWTSQPSWQPALAAARTDCWPPGRSGACQRPGSHANGEGRRRDTDPSSGRRQCAHVLGGARRRRRRPMLSSKLADSTLGAYATEWAAFITFFQAGGYLFLATMTETVAC